MAYVPAAPELYDRRDGGFGHLRSRRIGDGLVVREPDGSDLQGTGWFWPLIVAETMSEIKKQWYVVRAIGGKENKVKEYIEAEIRHNHLEDYISQVLIPTEKVYTIRNGKKVSKEKVSYPGYVLVEAAFVGQIPIIIRNTPNVLGFLPCVRRRWRESSAASTR